MMDLSALWLRRILLLSILIAGQSFGQGPFDPNTIDIAVLSASGKPVTGLSQNDFLLYENGQQREIVNFEAAAIPYQVLLIDECTGDPGGPRYSNRVTDPTRIPERTAPFQAVMPRFLDALADHRSVAFAQFGQTFMMLRDWSAPREIAMLRLRGLRESFGRDCRVNPSGLPERSFLEKLSWIESRLESVRGRKGVVWFGPPKNLPGEFVPDPPLALRPRREETRPPNIEDHPAFQTITEKLRRTGASFNFVLSTEEFTMGYQDEAERKRRFYAALQRWAEATGGQVVLASELADIEALAERLNQESGTYYRLGYRPFSQADTGDSVEVRTRNPELRVLQSRINYFR